MLRIGEIGFGFVYFFISNSCSLNDVLSDIFQHIGEHTEHDRVRFVHQEIVSGIRCLLQRFHQFLSSFVITE